MISFEMFYGIDYLYHENYLLKLLLLFYIHNGKKIYLFSISILTPSQFEEASCKLL